MSLLARLLLSLSLLLVCSAICIPLFDPLERPCDRGKKFSLAGHKALIITTSHSKLGAENCTSCKPAGVTLTEASVPFYTFKEAGLSVDVASIKGGKIPDDGFIITHWDCRLFKDKESWAQFQKSLAIKDLDFTSYDIVYMAGGSGASWDLGVSEVLGESITKAYAAGRLLGSVCHGALGFIRARKPDGSLLVNGTKMTAVTNRQVEVQGIAKEEPMHPEDELRKRGAVYEANHAPGPLELAQSLVVVDDLTSNGRIITGQNQNSACGVAQKMLEHLEKDSAEPYARVLGSAMLV